MYAIAHRAILRLGVCIALLYCFALIPAHAITKGDMGQFRYNKSGSTVSIFPNQSGYSGPLSPISNPASKVGTQIGDSGWYYGGMGSSPNANTTGQTMIMGHYGDVYFAGTKYPFQAGYQVPISALTTALGLLCTNPIVCTALTLATPTIADWLTSSGVGINQDPATMNAKPWTIDRKKYIQGCNSQADQDIGPGAGCFGQYDGVYIQMTGVELVNGVCSQYFQCSNGSHPHTLWKSWQMDRTEQMYRDPATLADIKPIMKFPSDPANLIKDILDKGGDIELDRPTVTGPDQVTGPTTTTKNPDGTTTTKQDSSKFKTQDNTVTQTSTGDATQKCDSTGKCETTTTEETDPTSAEKQKALCEQYPDIVACAIGDTPKAPIPQESKEISYTAENIFGSGSCPSDRYLRLHNGQNIKVWDWQNSCEKIILIRPLVIALGGFAALMVLIPGLKGDLI